VPAAPERVWERVITPAGINHELRPWMVMTVPRGLERLDPETVRLGERIGRSWVLLFGLFPFEYDDITLIELEPGRRFLERSPMLSMRSWQHERIVEAAEGGSRVSDRIRMEPRLGLPAAPLRRSSKPSSGIGTGASAPGSPIDASARAPSMPGLDGGALKNTDAPPGPEAYLFS
jgi:hypothetical protein